MRPANRLLLIGVTIVILVGITSNVSACPFCHPPSGVNQVNARIFDEMFWGRAAAVLAPFPIFAGIVALIYYGPTSGRRPKSNWDAMRSEAVTDRRPLIAAATLLGIGLGGFIDGILFHQLLQFHNMLSGADYYPKTGLPAEALVVNMEINMFWDGLFHVLTWTMTVAGLAVLWRTGSVLMFRGPRVLCSAVFLWDGDFLTSLKASSTTISYTSTT